MKENSIEEYMKIVEQIKDIFLHLKFHGWINDIKQDIDTDKVIKALEHILSDYKRVQKENEELLEVKVSASAHNRILELEKENEEYKKILSDCNKAKDIDRIKSINERILELEELLNKEEK